MTEIQVDTDIILQMQICKVADETNTTTDQLVAIALEHFLRDEGYNNLAEKTETPAA